jgi:hypothetical protein
MDLKFSRIVFSPTFFFLTNARAMVVWHGPQILAHSVFPYEFLFDKKKPHPLRVRHGILHFTGLGDTSRPLFLWFLYYQTLWF